MTTFKSTRALQVLFLLDLLALYTEGLYIAQVRVHSYSNPTNLCAECSFDHPFQSPFGCCDKFEERNFCAGIDRCDNYFTYCLREFGTIAASRDCAPDTIQRSDSQTSGGEIDFSQAQVLGLDNPLIFLGISNNWEGVQLYIEVNDNDPGGEDEVVETFAIDIPNSTSVGDQETNPRLYTGTYNIAMIEISYQIVCEINYYGESCENLDHCTANQVNCTGNSHCINQNGTSLCQCLPGYIEPLCVSKNHCMNINCSSRGQCQNGLESYSCTCEPGYTGHLCEVDTNECAERSCSGNVDTTLIGAITGTIVLTVMVIVVVTISIAIVITHRKKETQSKDPETSHSHHGIVTTPNPGYGMRMTVSIPAHTTTGRPSELVHEDAHSYRDGAYDYVDTNNRSLSTSNHEEAQAD